MIEYKWKENNTFNNDSGISLLCINTKKRNELKKVLEKSLFLKEANTEEAFKYNHHENVPMHKKRDPFYKGISNGTINEKNILKYMKKYGRTSFFNRCINKVKNIIKRY